MRNAHFASLISADFFFLSLNGYRWFNDEKEIRFVLTLYTNDMVKLIKLAWLFCFNVLMLEIVKSLIFGCNHLNRICRSIFVPLILFFFLSFVFGSLHWMVCMYGPMPLAFIFLRLNWTTILFTINILILCVLLWADLNEPFFSLCHLMARSRIDDCFVRIITNVGTFVFLRQVFTFVLVEIATDQNGHHHQQQE